MTITTIEERIANAMDRIAKKSNTITKKEALIVKKENKIQEMTDESEIRWTGFEIRQLHEDIERLHSEIAETQKKLDEYNLQKDGLMKKESLLKDIPENLKKMQSDLVEIWDEYDIERRAFLREEESKLGYSKFMRKYSMYDYDMMYKTDEQIHKSNIQDAKDMILNLIYRVRDITGEITDWNGIRAEIGTWGMSVLNGVVIGKQGIARVESIFAGGYNIQRLHVRVLVHEC